jgi:hypothetical protein
MLKISVYRCRASLEYQRDPNAGFDWHNSDHHNSLDTFSVLDDQTNQIIFSAKAQTVANAEGLIAGVHFYDTIAPGKFQLRAFVDPRAFKCQPHGIVNAITKRGEYILADPPGNGTPGEDDSTTLTNQSRWLVHDWRNHANPPQDTRVAWSAGCFVIADADLDRLNILLHDKGVIPGDLIDGILQEEGES